MKFYRIWNIDSKSFIKTNNNDVWKSLSRAKAYVNLKNKNAIKRYNQIQYNFIILEYEVPQKAYKILDNEVKDAEMELNLYV